MGINLSYSARMALKKGVIISIITAVVYLTIVVATTPNLPPQASIKAAFSINSIVIIGISIGAGAQIFISSYSKSMGCRLNRRKHIIGADSGSGALGSFFSFFSLVPLGCCGSWLLVLSYLPSVFGSTLSVALIQYSKPLSYVGLVMVMGFSAVSAYKLHKELNLRKRRIQETQEDFKIESK